MSATLDQRLAALDLGNAVRQEHAHIKRTLLAMGDRGPAAAADMLMRQIPTIETMRVRALVSSLRFVGRQKVKMWLRLCGIDTDARCGELSFRQRQALASELRLFARRTSERRPYRAARNPLRCAACGAQLREPDPRGMCGFCVEEMGS